MYERVGDRGRGIELAKGIVCIERGAGSSAMANWPSPWGMFLEGTEHQRL